MRKDLESLRLKAAQRLRRAKLYANRGFHVLGYCQLLSGHAYLGVKPFAAVSLALRNLQ